MEAGREIRQLVQLSGEGNGNPLQDSCLENPMGGGAWWATSPRGHKESDATEQLHLCSDLGKG